MLDALNVGHGAVALGIGMLVGLERERHKGEGEHRAFAGLRTYSITGLLGYVTQQVGGALLLGLIALCLAWLPAGAPAASEGVDSDDPYYAPRWK